MLDAFDITAEEAAGLTELAALELATAKRFTERANAAEDPDEANRFARTAQRAARSFRQTLALKVRLKRALAEHGREYARKAPDLRPQPSPNPPAPIPPHLAETRQAVSRLVWSEYEAMEAPEDEREDFLDDMLYGLNESLRSRARDTAFAARPLDDQVAEVAAELALPATTRNWRELPDPPPEAMDIGLDPEPPPPPWRGSG
jgi:hypothetical protein